MFKDNEILQHIRRTEEGISHIGGVVGVMLQKLEALQEQVEYLAAAEEARATHSKKPTRKPKSEETPANG